MWCHEHPAESLVWAAIYKLIAAPCFLRTLAIEHRCILEHCAWHGAHGGELCMVTTPTAMGQLDQIHNGNSTVGFSRHLAIICCLNPPPFETTPYASAKLSITVMTKRDSNNKQWTHSRHARIRHCMRTTAVCTVTGAANYMTMMMMMMTTTTTTTTTTMIMMMMVVVSVIVLVSTTMLTVSHRCSYLRYDILPCMTV